MRDIPPTRLDSLERALEAGYKAGLAHVYVGNLPGHNSESTFCPSCKAVVLERLGYRTEIKGRGKCPSCATAIAGVWE
jgi:pyruvate formate lyase activating enzyme